MKLGLTYILIVTPWLVFTAWAMATFSPWWGWLLLIPACVSLSSST